MTCEWPYTKRSCHHSDPLLPDADCSRSHTSTSEWDASRSRLPGPCIFRKWTDLVSSSYTNIIPAWLRWANSPLAQLQVHDTPRQSLTVLPNRAADDGVVVCKVACQFITAVPVVDGQLVSLTQQWLNSWHIHQMDDKGLNPHQPFSTVNKKEAAESTMS